MLFIMSCLIKKWSKQIFFQFKAFPLRWNFFLFLNHCFKFCGLFLKFKAFLLNIDAYARIIWLMAAMKYNIFSNYAKWSESITRCCHCINTVLHQKLKHCHDTCTTEQSAMIVMVFQIEVSILTQLYDIAQLKQQNV